MMGQLTRACIHIGPYKTGTSYVQQVLRGNKSVLADSGISLPRDDVGLQIRSVQHLLGRRRRRSRPGVGRDQWDELVDEARASGAHTAVLSMEMLCTATAPAVQRMVNGFAPAEVSIIFSARDYGRLLPAAWQTALRNRYAPSWREFLQSARDPDDEAAGPWGTRFWRQQEPRAVLAPYLRHIPAARIHVVTVPPSGSSPGHLWERFCQVAGLDAAAYDQSVVARTNASLGGVEAEVLRRVNEMVAGRIPGRAYNDLVKQFVAREVLERREQSFRLVLPVDHLDWVQRRSREQIDYLRAGGFPVAGDLDDLLPAREWSDRAPDDVTDDAVRPVLEELLGATLREMARRQRLRAHPGPRIDERPLPEPAELGLTGRPPLPDERPRPQQPRPASGQGADRRRGRSSRSA